MIEDLSDDIRYVIEDLDKMQEIENIQSVISPLIREMCEKYGRDRVVDALRSFVNITYIYSDKPQELRDYP